MSRCRHPRTSTIFAAKDPLSMFFKHISSNIDQCSHHDPNLMTQKSFPNNFKIISSFAHDKQRNRSDAYCLLRYTQKHEMLQNHALQQMRKLCLNRIDCDGITNPPYPTRRSGSWIFGSRHDIDTSLEAFRARNPYCIFCQ